MSCGVQESDTTMIPMAASLPGQKTVIDFLKLFEAYSKNSVSICA